MPVTLNFDIQSGLQETLNFNLKINNLGDSYQQISHGILRSTFSAKSSFLNQAKKNEIQSILENANGIVEIFWKPLSTQPVSLYRVLAWSFQEVSPNSHIFSGSFEESTEIDCQEIELELDTSDLERKLGEAWNFIKRFTRDNAPNFANTANLPCNAFHDVEGRGNYFPSVCGTTEGVFIIALALLNYRDIAPDNDKQPLIDYVASMLGSSESVLYRGVTSQSLIGNTDSQIWLPHWLYTMRGSAPIKGATVEPNFLQSGYFDLEVNFNNGVGFINADLADIYLVHNGQLLWQSVISPIITGSGTSFEINYWINKFNKKVTTESTEDNTTGHPIGTVVLVNTDTGTFKCVYSLYTGLNVPNNSTIEAFPMWRATLTGQYLERNHAVDVSNWAVRCYLKLIEITQETKWQAAFDATKYSTIQSSDVQNESYVFKIDTDTTDPLSYAGTQLVEINGKTGSLSRVTTGNFIGGVLVTHNYSDPLTYGQLEIQNFAVQAIWTRSTYMQAEFETSLDTLLFFGVSTSEDAFNTSDIYYAYYYSQANTPYTKQFYGASFGKYFPDKTFWHPTNADSPIYKYDGGNGAYAITNYSMQVYGDREILTLHFSADKTGSFAGGGFSVLTGSPRLNNNFTYKLSGVIELWVKDADSNDFYYNLPVTTDFETIYLTWDLFTPANGTDTPNINDPITGVELKEPVNCELYLYYFGDAPTSLPASSYVYKHTIVNKKPDAMTWRVGNVEVLNSPLNLLPYAPGVQPFTSNHVGTTKISWTGSPYVGYQSPQMWYLLGLNNNAQQVVDFFKASQDSYASESPTSTNWVFRQVFNWARWDAVARPPYNVFLDDGADPNTRWEGYCVRAIGECAEFWKNNPNNTNARIVVMRYLVGVYNFLQANDPDLRPPTDYLPPSQGLPEVNYTTPHSMAYILRAAIYANLAGGDRLVTIWLIVNMWKALENEFINTGLMTGSFTVNQPDYYSNFDNATLKEYFGFWHGEIIESLVILKKEKANLRFPSCSAWGT
ncbi:MAG: hypothetical protein AAF316_00220 [Cyanobacteria bacterium P01_A01_bin.80]